MTQLEGLRPDIAALYSIENFAAATSMPVDAAQALLDRAMDQFREARKVDAARVDALLAPRPIAEKITS